MHSCPSSAAAAIRSEESAEAGTPAGTIVVRAAGLRVHGMTVATGDGVPSGADVRVCSGFKPAKARFKNPGMLANEARNSSRCSVLSLMYCMAPRVDCEGPDNTPCRSGGRDAPSDRAGSHSGRTAESRL